MHPRSFPNKNHLFSIKIQPRDSCYLGKANEVEMVDNGGKKWSSCSIGKDNEAIEWKLPCSSVVN
jgi:hypothetical protein